MTKQEGIERLYRQLSTLLTEIYVTGDYPKYSHVMEESRALLQGIKKSGILENEASQKHPVECIEVMGYEWIGKVYKDQTNSDDLTFYKVYGDIDVRFVEGETLVRVGTIHCDDLGFSVNSVDKDALNSELESKFGYTDENKKLPQFVNDPRN